MLRTNFRIIQKRIINKVRFRQEMPQCFDYTLRYIY